MRENSYSWANDVDGEIVIRLACRGTIKLLVGTLCTVFYCMPHSSSVLLSSLAIIAGHSLISTQRYRYNCGRLKSYFFFFEIQLFERKLSFLPFFRILKLIELCDSLEA